MEQTVPWSKLIDLIEPIYPSSGRRVHQTRKGQQWYFGMKIHIGAEVNSGAVHTVTTTAANVADINELPNLLRKDDHVIFADAGYSKR